MNFIRFETGKDDLNRRIDKVIRIFCPEINLSSIYKYFRKGLIKVNGKKISSDYRIAEGDMISIAEFICNQKNESENKNEGISFIKKKENKSAGKSEASEYKNDAEKMDSDSEKAIFFEDARKNSPISLPEIKVIFKNDDFLAINKPYDFVVHGNSSSKNPGLDQIVKKLFPSKSNSLAFSPGPLHRLDKKTTGILFFSQSIDGARWFSQKLQEHEIQKIYIGIVQGWMPEKQIWIDEISRNEDGKQFSEEIQKSGATKEKKVKNAFHTVNIKIGKKDAFYDSSSKFKTAETEATPLIHGKCLGNDITVVQFYIKTGRTHQIRSQSSHHGFPLIGDTAYSGKKIENESRDFYLHAYKIIFNEKMDESSEEKKSSFEGNKIEGNKMDGAESFRCDKNACKENHELPSEIVCPPDEDFLDFIQKTCGKTSLQKLNFF